MCANRTRTIRHIVTCVMQSRTLQRSAAQHVIHRRYSRPEQANTPSKEVVLWWNLAEGACPMVLMGTQAATRPS